MVSIDNNVELMKFINKEKKIFMTFNYHKLFKCFSTCLLKTFLCCVSKLENKSQVVACINVMYHVFWIIINYTKNLSTTIFLSERSILLFNEFMLMSNNPSISKELYFTPNITDAINFAYKKTIGPISLKNIPKNKMNNNCLLLLKNIMIYIYQKIDYNDFNNHFNIYFKCIESTIIKNQKIINNNKYYYLIYEKTIDICSKNQNIIEFLLKFRLINNYIINLKNRDIFTFEKKLNDYYMYINNNNIKNIDLNIKNIDINLKNIDLYKNIV